MCVWLALRRCVHKLWYTDKGNYSVYCCVFVKVLWPLCSLNSASSVLISSSVAVIIALILGGVSLSKMKTDLLPDMVIPYLMVMTTDPGRKR